MQVCTPLHSAVCALASGGGNVVSASCPRPTTGVLQRDMKEPRRPATAMDTGRASLHLALLSIACVGERLRPLCAGAAESRFGRSWNGQAGWRRRRCSRVPCAGTARVPPRPPPPPRPPAPPDRWTLLGIKKGASALEVRQAFRRAIRAGAHPDQGGDPDAFLQLRIAYDKALADAYKLDATSTDVASSSATPSTSSNAASVAQAAGREETVEDAQPAKPRTLEEFYAFKKSAKARQAVISEVRRRQSRRDKATSPKDAVAKLNALHQRMHRNKKPELTRRALHNAPTKESREAWQREVEAEGVAAEAARLSSFASRAAELNYAADGDGEPRQRTTLFEDHIVGHRIVRSRSGDVRVPIFQANDGARYYVSPLTKKRVAIPM